MMRGARTRAVWLQPRKARAVTSHSSGSIHLCLRASDLSQFDVGEILNEVIFCVLRRALIEFGGGCRYFLLLQMLGSSRDGYVVAKLAAMCILLEKCAPLNTFSGVNNPHQKLLTSPTAQTMAW